MATAQRSSPWLRRATISVAVLAAVLVTGTAMRLAPSRGIEAAAPIDPVPGIERPRAPFDVAFADGIARLRAGDAHGAAKAFEQARQLQPHAPEPYANLGFAYLELGTMAAAKSAFERALEIRPEQLNAYYGLAEALDALGERTAAIGAMRTYVHLSGDADPFRRRALAALWEWGAMEGTGQVASVDTARDTAPDSGPDAAAPSHGPARSLSALALTAFDGSQVSFQRYGGRVVVLNVWATWCPPCRREMPGLQRLADILDGDKFAVIGLSVDKDGDFAREFLTDLDIRFANFWDKDALIAGDRLGLDAYPHTLIIDGRGTVVREISGQRDWDSAPMIAMIESIAEGGVAASGLEKTE